MTSSSQEPEFHPTMSQIVATFGVQALVACGKLVNPVTQKHDVDLRMAKYHIGVLELLKQKTVGNLTNEDDQALTNTLHQVKMAYLDASSHARAEREDEDKEPTPPEHRAG